MSATISQESTSPITPVTQRIALCVSYNGRNFSGWQAQLKPNLRTGQECLEKALAAIAAQPVRVSCAGRTDAGVHASGQVVHFDTASKRELKAWVRGVNTHLPQDIAVNWAHPVPDDFHARFSALSRRYRYCIYNQKVRPALLGGLTTFWHQTLDAGLMHEAGQHLLGAHDFGAFRGAGCQARTATRTVHSLDVFRHGQYVIVDIQANAFLLHMVRNIVGVLLQIGEGRKPPAWAAEVLDTCDRTKAAITAPADGLCLIDVGYPTEFRLPAAPEYFLGL